MIFPLLQVLSLEGNGCPPGTEYFFDRTVHTELKADSWYYFYTTHVQMEEPLSVSIKTNATIEFYEGSTGNCPVKGETPLLVAYPKKVNRTPVPVKKEIGVIILGVYASEPADVYVKLEGQHKKQKGISNLTKLLILTGAMVLTLVVLFFIITAPKKKEKEE